MRISVAIGGDLYWVDHGAAASIAIPLNFAEHPILFGVPAAEAKAVEVGDFVGDTRRGGSCNVQQVSFVPHCHGTHTESAGHIVSDEYAMHSAVAEAFVPAALVSVTPAIRAEVDETYPYEGAADRVITRGQLKDALADTGKFPFKALVIRTLPNDSQKCVATYNGEPVPPYLTTEAIKFCKTLGIRHLLVDVPSIDRIIDDGQLANHHAYWNVVQGSKSLSDYSSLLKSITELVFVPDELADGIYLLNLQVADFMLDAAPSRPVLIPLTKATTK